MQTRSSNLNPLLYSVAIIAFGVIFWSSFAFLHHDAGNPPPNFASLTFDVLPGDPVAMIIHNTLRYNITRSGTDDFTPLLPPGGHLVHVGSPPKVYTPTLLHQMKCLGIIQVAFVGVPDDSAATPTPLVSHCLNYLRQSILCRPNMRLESVTDGSAASEKEYETVCRDWVSVLRG